MLRLLFCGLAVLSVSCSRKPAPPPMQLEGTKAPESTLEVSKKELSPKLEDDCSESRLLAAEKDLAEKQVLFVIDIPTKGNGLYWREWGGPYKITIKLEDAPNLPNYIDISGLSKPTTSVIQEAEAWTARRRTNFETVISALEDYMAFLSRCHFEETRTETRIRSKEALARQLLNAVVNSHQLLEADSEFLTSLQQLNERYGLQETNKWGHLLFPSSPRASGLERAIQLEKYAEEFNKLLIARGQPTAGRPRYGLLGWGEKASEEADYLWVDHFNRLVMQPDAGPLVPEFHRDQTRKSGDVIRAAVHWIVDPSLVKSDWETIKPHFKRFIFLEAQLNQRGAAVVRLRTKRTVDIEPYAITVARSVRKLIREVDGEAKGRQTVKFRDLLSAGWEDYIVALELELQEIGLDLEFVEGDLKWNEERLYDRIEARGRAERLARAYHQASTFLEITPDRESREQARRYLSQERLLRDKLIPALSSAPSDGRAVR